MTVKEKLINTIRFDNGLELNFYDSSRKVAGDRWQVGIVARIDIPVDNAHFSEFNGNVGDLAAFRKACGEKVRFEQKRQRNFIDAKYKDSVRRGLMDSFLKSALAYLSHADFAKKQVFRQYKEYLKRKTWYPR
jgi:hypothetical protein